jgi:hypothetical protein
MNYVLYRFGAQRQVRLQAQHNEMWISSEEGSFAPSYPLSRQREGGIGDRESKTGLFCTILVQWRAARLRYRAPVGKWLFLSLLKDTALVQ